MSESSKQRALIVRAFNDAGTEKRYRKGETALLDAGTFANYSAAGLVTEAPAAKPKPAAAAPKATQSAPAAPLEGSEASDT